MKALNRRGTLEVTKTLTTWVNLVLDPNTPPKKRRPAPLESERPLPFRFDRPNIQDTDFLQLIPFNSGFIKFRFTLTR